MLGRSTQSLGVNVRVGTQTWSLEMSEGWRAQFDAECLTLEPIQRDSAFQLSGMVKTKGNVLSPEVETQARRLEAVSGSPIPVAFGGFEGFAVSYSEDGIHWKRYWLARGNLLLFATFYGGFDSWQLRGRDVEAMLCTLEDKGVDA